MISEEINFGNFFDGIDDVVFSANPSFPPAVATIDDSCLPVPYDDIDELEWPSNCIDNSLSPSNQFHISCPISNLDDSSSSRDRDSFSSGDKQPLTTANIHSRARSRRPRPRSFVPRPTNYGKFCSPLPAKKAKKIKILPFSPEGLRKCLHCEATKTPQWRAGPLGHKTLCNACGVRYKSGRLLPEYRPAMSPSFDPSLHSNSHKKVLQMRNKVGRTEPLSSVNTDRDQLSHSVFN